MASSPQLQPARELLKAELVLEAIRRSGRAEIRVTGMSMLPAVRAGDLVTVRKDSPDCAHPGDIVLFYRDEQFYLHRVVERCAGMLITRGDANRDCDPPVTAAEFVGRVVCVRRRGAQIAFEHRRLLTWFLCRSAFIRELHARLAGCGENIQSIVPG